MARTGDVCSSALSTPVEAVSAYSVDILVERGRISAIRFNRPTKRNAITLRMWRELEKIVSDLESDRSVRAIVLTGESCFSAGADISEFGDVRADAAQAAKYEGIVEATLSRLHDCEKPTIAAVQGFCLGGGMAIAQACDFRIADSTASFSVPAAKLGIVYNERECQSLMSIVGATNAKRILFSGEKFNAAHAARIGFVELVHDGETLQNALHLAEALAANAPLSIAGMKFIVNRLSEGRAEMSRSTFASKIDQALESRDYHEAIMAFREKRKVKFLGI